MEVLVGVKPEKEWPKKLSMPELSGEMQEALERAIPTVVFNATQPIQMRVESHLRRSLKIYGEDWQRSTGQPAR